jgi:hypothetical protein
VQPRLSYVTSGLVGGIGLSMTIGGGVRLAGVPREKRRPSSVGRALAVAGIALATAVASQALLYLISIPDLVCSD